MISVPYLIMKIDGIITISQNNVGASTRTFKTVRAIASTVPILTRTMQTHSTTKSVKKTYKHLLNKAQGYLQSIQK